MASRRAPRPTDVAANQRLPPGWVPFQLTADEASRWLVQALASSRLPSDFVQTAEAGPLERVWLPAWRMTARVVGAWRGQAQGSELPALDGPATRDSHFQWRAVDGEVDEPLVTWMPGTFLGSFMFLEKHYPVDALEVQTNEPSGATRLPREIEREAAMQMLLVEGERFAARLAEEQHDGTRLRDVTVTVQTRLESMRAVWLPYYRAVHVWRGERHRLLLRAGAGEPALEWIDLPREPAVPPSRSKPGPFDPNSPAAWRGPAGVWGTAVALLLALGFTVESPAWRGSALVAALLAGAGWVVAWRRAG